MKHLLLPAIFILPEALFAQTFIEVGSMSGVRLNGTMNELADGRVLICGGIDPGPVTELASAEIYDPATQLWSTVAPMSRARNGHTATLLDDGRVFVFGGVTTGTAPDYIEEKEGELYDPAANSWTTTSTWTDVVGTNGVGRVGHNAVLINGKVLLLGGGTNECEWYDPITDAFSSANMMNLARNRMGVVRSGNYVVAVGANTGNADRIEVLDIAANTWSLVTAPLSVEREHPAVLDDGSGGFWIAGGQDGNSPSVVEYFDRAAGTITTGSNPPVVDHTFDSYALCTNDDITGFGGGDIISWLVDGDTETLEVYDTGNGTWSTTQDYGFTVPGMASHVRLSNGNVLTAGGMLLVGPINENFTARSYLIDPCGSSLGLVEEVEREFQLYPNPTNGQAVRLELGSNATIVVVDVNGRTLLSANARAGSAVLPTEGLPAGVYLVHVMQANTTASVRLVVTN